MAEILYNPAGYPYMSDFSDIGYGGQVGSGRTGVSRNALTNAIMAQQAPDQQAAFMQQPQVFDPPIRETQGYTGYNGPGFDPPIRETQMPPQSFSGRGGATPGTDFLNTSDFGGGGPEAVQQRFRNALSQQIPDWFQGGQGDWNRYLNNFVGFSGGRGDMNRLAGNLNVGGQYLFDPSSGDGSSGGVSGLGGGDVTGVDSISPGGSDPGSGGRDGGGRDGGGRDGGGRDGGGRGGDFGPVIGAPINEQTLGENITYEGLPGSASLISGAFGQPAQDPVQSASQHQQAMEALTGAQQGLYGTGYQGGFYGQTGQQYGGQNNPFGLGPTTSQASPQVGVQAPNSPSNPYGTVPGLPGSLWDALNAYNQAQNPDLQGSFSTAGMSLADLADAWGVSLDSAQALAEAGFADLSGGGGDPSGGFGGADAAAVADAAAADAAAADAAAAAADEE